MQPRTWRPTPDAEFDSRLAALRGGSAPPHPAPSAHVSRKGLGWGSRGCVARFSLSLQSPVCSLQFSGKTWSLFGAWRWIECHLIWMYFSRSPPPTAQPSRQVSRLLQQHGTKTARISSDSRCGMQLEVRQEGRAVRWHVPQLRYQAGKLVAIASISRAPAVTCACAHTRRVLQGRATAAGLQPPMDYMPQGGFGYPPLHGSFAPPPSYH